MSVFSFMQITDYSLEVNGLKQERTTQRYLRSFSCYRNDLNLEGFILTFTKEKVTQKQYLRVTHTYGLIEEKISMESRK